MNGSRVAKPKLRNLTVRMYRQIKHSILEELKITDKDISVSYDKFSDGIIFGVKEKKVGDKIVWDKHEINVKIDRKNTIQTYVNTRFGIVWLKPQDMGHVYRKVIKRKVERIRQDLEKKQYKWCFTNNISFLLILSDLASVCPLSSERHRCGRHRLEVYGNCFDFL
mgnify:CR=1 FL=1